MTTDSELMAMDYANAQAREREERSKARGKSNMSLAQRDLYWSLWFKVCRAKKLNPHDKEVRHNTVASILEWSGGEAKPFAEFSQPDFGVVKFAFMELAAGRKIQPDQLVAVRELEHRRNLMFVINQLMGRYGRKNTMNLLRERFHIFLIEELDTREIEGPMGLEQIRETLVARTYKPKN